MRRKREAHGKHAPRARETPADHFARWDELLLAVVTCLLVATPLVPSEATAHEGTAAPLNLLWTLALFCWAALLVLRPDPQVNFGWTSVAAAALVGWHTLSGIVAVYSANGRQALNMSWQMLSYAIAAFLLRQLLRTPAQCRALLVVMIAVASLEAVQGYYEYFISKPAALAEFKKHSEQTYQELGAVTQSQREHLRWRIENPEPMATFALTNSLAGLLAPLLIALFGIWLTIFDRWDWLRLLAGVGVAVALVAGYFYLTNDDKALRLAPGLIVLIAISMAALGGRDWLRPRIGVVVVSALVVGCLLLTNSRTGILATLCGTVLLALYGHTNGVIGRWIGWRIPALVAGGLVVIGLVVVGFGGLNVQFLSDAQTSVLYRIQYWRSTAAIIADYPLFGCGPGQFQEAFATYKLPEASETPRDPHNFLLEIWSTAGTPAILSLLAMAVAFAWQLAAARPVSNEVHGDVHNEHPSRLWLYGGGLLGIVLAAPLGLVVGYPLELVPLFGALQLPGIWLWGLPTAAICMWLLEAWVRQGTLPTAAPVIALIALLINLLAAGATSFPGVFMTAWILIPLALANAQAPAWTHSPRRSTALGVLAAAVALAILSMRTEFSPVLSLSNRLAVAEQFLQAGRAELALQELALAAAEDPWSPAPQRLLAYATLNVWVTTRSPDDWDRFVAAADAYQRLNPRHHAAYTDRGHWLLLAWRTSGDPRHLEGAIDAYRQAALWYPGRGLERAQLAWTLHLAGRAAEAQAAAEEARRLDELSPHRELKLSQQTIYDPKAGADGSSQSALNAEQVVRQLRTSSPEKPQ